MAESKRLETQKMPIIVEKRTQQIKEARRKAHRAQNFINLNLQNIDLVLTECDIVGGEPIFPLDDIENTLNEMHNTRYRCLKNKSNDEFLYYFDNHNNKKDKNNITKYMDAGGNTIVFSITDISGGHQQYVLKVQKFFKNKIEEYLDLFLKNYKRDYTELLTNNCPNIYMYGLLSVDDEKETDFCLFYTVMEKYETSISYYNKRDKVLTFEQSFNILLEITNRLCKLHSKNYYLRDLKMDNIGFSKNFTPIFIDYDPYICQKYQKDETYPPCDTIFIGNTYYPYYVMECFITNNDNIFLDEFFGIYEKIESVALGDIILNLFFMPILNMTYGGLEYIQSIYNGGMFKLENGEKLILNEIKNGKTIFENTSNIEDLNKMLEFIKCFPRVYGGSDDIIKFGRTLRNFLLNSDENKGFLHIDFDKIYNYEDLLRYLLLFKDNIEKQKQVPQSISTISPPQSIIPSEIKSDVSQQRKLNFEQLRKEIAEMKKAEMERATEIEYVVKPNHDLLSQPIESSGLKMDNTGNIGGKKYKIVQNNHM
jgi:hypothetical protein